MDRTSHKHPADRVKEWQAPGLGILSHDGHDLLDPLGLAAFIRPPGVHLGGLGAAGAGGRGLDAEAL